MQLGQVNPQTKAMTSRVVAEIKNGKFLIFGLRANTPARTFAPSRNALDWQFLLAKRGKTCETRPTQTLGQLSRNKNLAAAKQRLAVAKQKELSKNSP
jgi:hypothetical protein